MIFIFSTKKNNQKQTKQTKQNKENKQNKQNKQTNKQTNKQPFNFPIINPESPNKTTDIFSLTFNNSLSESIKEDCNDNSDRPFSETET